MDWKDLPYPGPIYDETVDTIIRQSIIGQMQLCEKRVEYQGTEGFLPMVSEPLCFGTMVHHLCAEDLRIGETRLDLLLNMNEWVEQILVEQYDWSLSQVPNVRDFFTEVTTAYRQWRTTVFPKLPTEYLALEQEMFLYLGEGTKGNLFLKGTPDVVYPNTLMDWKTAGRGWKVDKAHLSIQASLYMALVKQNLDVALRKFVFWVYDKQKREWTAIRTERRIKDVNAALRTAFDMARKVEARIFTASPVPESAFVKKRGWYCSAQYCEAWNVCDYKWLADNVNESEQAVRSW